MNKRIWISLCTVAALLAACDQTDDAVQSANVSVETIPDNAAAPGEQETTPGGVAGETAANPPGAEPVASTP